MFETRTLYYLRISPHSVLPMFLYLDASHLEWMSDRTLQRVLTYLQPLIGPKLKAEADVGTSGSKRKGTVEVGSGDGYQMAFFFRKTEPHQVLLKHRNFVAVKPTPKVNPRPDDPAPPKGKKRRASKSANPIKGTRKGKRKRSADSEEDAESSGFDSSDSDAATDAIPRTTRSRRTRPDAREDEDGLNTGVGDDNQAMPSNRESETEDEPPLKAEEADDPQLAWGKETAGIISNPSPELPIDVDAEEEKPKLKVELSYTGFSIFGKCLCVVVQPSPSTSSTVDGARAPMGTTRFRSASVDIRASLAPEEPPSRFRSQTPLFLRETPAPENSATASSNARVLPPVPLFFEEDEDLNDDGGLLEFTQILADTQRGAGFNEDLDDEGEDVFLGDADEGKGGL